MMIILTGGSASGKDSIVNSLCNNYGYNKVIQYTTREKRPLEIQDKDYHFISEWEYNNLIESNIVFDDVNYNDWHYVTLNKDIAPFDKKNNKDVKKRRVCILTPSQIRLYTSLWDSGYVIYYIKVNRRDRLIKSLQRGDNIEEAYRRSCSDMGMFDNIENIPYINTINNDGYKYSANQIAGMINVN